MNRFCTFFLLGVFFCPGLGFAQNLVDKVDTTFDHITELNVKGAFCKVEIYANGGEGVRLEGEIRAVRQHEDLGISYTQDGGTLNIWIDQPRNLSGQVKGYLLITAPANLELNLVETVSGNIKIVGVGNKVTRLRSVSGGIEANDIGSELFVNTVSGDVNVNGVGGNLHLKAVSGALKAGRVQGVADVSSVSGAINISSVSNGVDVNTTSGKIYLFEVQEGAKVKSVSGSIFLSNVKGNGIVETSSGIIDVDGFIGEACFKSSSGGISGKGVMITGNSTFRTISASINIGLENDLNALSFVLSSSSGMLEVGSRSAKRKLMVDDGPIVITGSSVTGNQRYK